MQDRLRIELLLRDELEVWSEDLRVLLDPWLAALQHIRLDRAVEIPLHEPIRNLLVFVLGLPARLLGKHEIVAEPAPGGVRRVAGRLDRLPGVIAPQHTVLLTKLPNLGRVGLRQRGGDVGLLAALEHVKQAVVVLRGDRLELVVVAAGAGDREPEHAAADRVDRVVERVVVDLHILPPADRQESKPAERLRVGGGVELIGGDLLLNEAVERLVCIERLHDIVTVGPGIRHRVFVAAVGAAVVGIAGHVEPVPPPSLAIPRIGQQPVEQPLKGLRRRIGGEGLDLGERRRHADQIE